MRGSVAAPRLPEKNAAARTTEGSSSATTRVFKPRIGEECARRDAGAEAHHQSAPRLARVNQQRQERLETHVAQRRRRVAGVRNALDVEPTEAAARRLLLEHGDGPAGVFRVEDERPAALLGQQSGQLVARRERQAERRRAPSPRRRRVDARAPPLQQRDAAPSSAPATARTPSERDEPQRRHENEAGEERAGDPTGGVPREGRADVPADAVARSRSGGRPPGRPRRGTSWARAAPRPRPPRSAPRPRRSRVPSRASPTSPRTSARRAATGPAARRSPGRSRPRRPAGRRAPARDRDRARRGARTGSCRARGPRGRWPASPRTRSSGCSGTGRAARTRRPRSRARPRRRRRRARARGARREARAGAGSACAEA